MWKKLIISVLLVTFAIVADADEIPVKLIKQAPIVIKTPDGNFDQPSFDDYKICMKNFDSCTEACDNVKDCLEKCPKCPLLVEEAAIVQGINDTDYRAPISKSLNATNIIRLTNEIHNVIENNLGDVRAVNQNNVTVYQQNSKENSTSSNTKNCDNKFKMGCDERGQPCCVVISKQRKRQKHCGERCQAPVMYARSVVQCADENDLNSCGHFVEYKPYRERRRSQMTAAAAVPHSAHRCRYQEKWPFVSCPIKRTDSSPCTPQCLQLSYGYILQYGVPIPCIECYKNFNDDSPMPAAPIGYAPNEHDIEIPKELDGSDWWLEQQKWP